MTNNVTSVLRELRSQHRKTQEYMGTKLGISQSQYNKIEKGEKPLEFETLTKIAKLFNLLPKQLFTAIFEEEKPRRVFIIDGSQPKPSEETEEVESHYKKLAKYFENKFLETYKMYIELSTKSTHLVDLHNGQLNQS